MSIRIRVLLIICFMLLGLTHRAFAEASCPEPVDNSSCGYSFSASYYTTYSAAQADCIATGQSCWTLNLSFFGLPTGTQGRFVKSGSQTCCGNYCNYDLYLACPDCVDADADGKCDPCQEERAALEQQCGSSGYTMVDEDACEGRCNSCVDEAKEQCGDKEIEWTEDGDCSYRCLEPCQDMHDRLSYQCGGGDKYWLAAAKRTNPDGSGSEECAGACGTPPDANQDTDGDGTPDKQDDDIDGDGVPNDQDDDMDGDGIPNAQDTAPTVPGGVDTSKDPKYGGGNDVGTGGSDPGTADPQKTDPPPETPDPSFDCYEKWNNKVKECGGRDKLASWSNETCTGSCKTQSSSSCTKEQMDAADTACKYGYNMAPDCTYTCISCSELQQNCLKSCSPAAVKNNFCEEQNGKPVDVLCECENASACEQYKASCSSSCSSSGCGGVKKNECQEDSSGKITSKTCECNSCGDPPVPDPKQPDPQNSGDVAGWLKGIKRDTQTIADNIYAIKQSVDGLKNALSDVDIKGSEIVTKAGDSYLGNSGSITGDGYGSAPVDVSDVPGETSFGTFTPRTSGDGDHRIQVSEKLSGLSISASGGVCELSLSVPIPHIRGLSLTIEWRRYPLDFCQYESVLSAIGSILVFAAALRELYKFTV
jgi:hypothetical protein